MSLFLNLAEGLNRFPLGNSPYYESPFYYIRHPTLLALADTADKTQQLRRSEKRATGDVPTIGKDGFQVCMDVQQFKPSELTVKTVDNCVIIEGKHEEREDDHGYISRHFVRRYALPKGYDSNKVVSTLSSDGVLTVSASKPEVEDKSNERHVQIQQVGPAHLNIKENQKVEENAPESSEGEKAEAKSKK